MGVVITLKNGEHIFVRGYQSQVHDELVKARKDGSLLRLERDITPAGQMVTIDPFDVSIVKDD